MKRFIGFVLAIIGGGGLLYAIFLYLGQGHASRMFGYDPVFAGLACIAVLTAGVLLTQNH